MESSPTTSRPRRLCDSDCGPTSASPPRTGGDDGDTDTSGRGTQRSPAAASTTSRLSHPVLSCPATRPRGPDFRDTFTTVPGTPKALSGLGKGLELRKLVAGEGFEPSTS